MAAPVVLICYNRPAHLRRVLEALAPQAPEQVLAFSDGPRPDRPGDAAAVDEVRALLRDTLDAWPGAHQGYYSTAHLGLRDNVVAAADITFSQHESAIFLEDDCLPGPAFLAFMQEALTRYAANPLVMSVGAYTPPLPPTLLAEYPHDAYFLPRIETWGWATWRRAWTFYERDYATAWADCREDGLDLGTCGSDVPRNIQSHLDGRLHGWSPGWLMAVYRRGYAVYPTRSHVQNIGCDGSGDSPPSDRYGVELAAAAPARWPDGPFLDGRIVQAVREFYG